MRLLSLVCVVLHEGAAVRNRPTVRVPGSRRTGQEEPVSGPEIVLPSDCRLSVRVPSTSKQRPSDSTVGPNAYAQPAAPSPTSCIPVALVGDPGQAKAHEVPFTIAVENEPSRGTDTLALDGTAAMPNATETRVKVRR
jgi:hypothetical protein